MDISATNLTSSDASAASSATSYTTASIAPTANHLTIAWVFNIIGSGTAGTPTLSGASVTWTQIGTFLDASGLRRTTAFRSLNASPGSGAITIDFAGATQTGCEWSFEDVSGMDTTGTNGSGAIVANSASIANNTGVEVASSTTTGVTVTLSALSNASNATFGFCRNSATTTSFAAGSGYTALATTSSTRPLLSEYKSTGSTTVNWTWASTTTATRAAGLEIAVPSSPPATNSNFLFF